MNILKYNNNWESDQYYVDGHRAYLLRVQIGKFIYDVDGRNVSVGYTDMGNHYYASSMHFFITEDVFGSVFEFDLNELIRKKIDIKPIEWRMLPGLL